jgi:hypothetical protein
MYGVTITNWGMHIHECYASSSSSSCSSYTRYQFLLYFLLLFAADMGSPFLVATKQNTIQPILDAVNRPTQMLIPSYDPPWGRKKPIHHPLVMVSSHRTTIARTVGSYGPGPVTRLPCSTFSDLGKF